MAISTTPATGLAAAFLLLASPSPARAQARPDERKEAPAPPAPALEVAKVGFVGGDVEVQRPGGVWTKAVESQALAIGDRVRTLRGSTARLEFPWTVVAVGDASEVLIDKARVLTLQLTGGRIDVDPEQDLLRIVTPEAAVSGSGRTLVRREGTTTFVGSYNGGAEVEALGGVVRLGVNRGTVITAGGPPKQAATMPAAPRVVSPSADPRYARPGEDIALTWTGEQTSYHLEILPIDSDVPLVSLDVEATETKVRLEWLGTYRWRVSGRAGAVESQPSGEGLICVVEK